MKNLYGWLAVVIALSMLLLPLTAGKSKSSSLPASSQAVVQEDVTQYIKVKNSQTGEIKEMPTDEYIFCVVAAEMPALYHVEALKAQAVAAYTFALYKSEQNKSEDYDITDSPATDQSFKTKETAVAEWGENAQEYTKKIEEAISAVKNQAITYDGKIILSVYTAISSGKTESSENVFEQKLDYLVPKESIGDMLCPDYLSSASFTEQQVKDSLCTPNGIDSEYTSWFSSPTLSESGGVLSMDFGGKTLSGAQIREALGLRSINFDVSYSEGNFNFTVRGYGHLCGMSQYGANYMAMQGSGYKDILMWYYTNCEIVSVTAR